MPNYEYGAAETVLTNVTGAANPPEENTLFIGLNATQADDREYTAAQMRQRIGVITLPPVANIAARDVLSPPNVQVGWIVPVTDRGDGQPGDSMYTGVPARPWFNFWVDSTGLTDRGPFANDAARDAAAAPADGHFGLTQSDGLQNIYLAGQWVKLGSAAATVWTTITADAQILAATGQYEFVGAAVTTATLAAPAAAGASLVLRNNADQPVTVTPNSGTFASPWGDGAEATLLLARQAEALLHWDGTNYRLAPLTGFGATPLPPARFYQSYRRLEGATDEYFRVTLDAGNNAVWQEYLPGGTGGGISPILFDVPDSGGQAYDVDLAEDAQIYRMTLGAAANTITINRAGVPVGKRFTLQFVQPGTADATVTVNGVTLTLSPKVADIVANPPPLTATANARDRWLLEALDAANEYDIVGVS